MTSERIKEIQMTTAYPDSISVMLALKQVWNECAQEQNKNSSKDRACTQDVVDAAMKQASKEVRLPKVVRDGVVDLKGRKICKCNKAYVNPLSGICTLCWNELYPNEQDEVDEDDIVDYTQDWKELEDAKLCEPLKSWEDKEESLQEIAEKYGKKVIEEHQGKDLTMHEEIWLAGGSIVGFTEGAKWQEKRMYNQKEVIDLLWLLYSSPNREVDFTTKEELVSWFERLKKK